MQDRRASRGLMHGGRRNDGALSTLLILVEMDIGLAHTLSKIVPDEDTTVGGSVHR